MKTTISQKGFTLVELVMVIILMGIIAVIVVPRMPSRTTSNAGAFPDKLKADIRYAQNLAMTRNRRTRVYFNGTGTAPGSGYAVVIDNSAGIDCSSFAAVASPAAGGNLTVAVNAGSYAGITMVAAPSCLEYNSLGVPFDCSANLTICSATQSGATVNVSGGGVPAGSVVVTSQTGAVN